MCGLLGPCFKTGQFKPSTPAPRIGSTAQRELEKRDGTCAYQALRNRTTRGGPNLQQQSQAGVNPGHTSRRCGIGANVTALEPVPADVLGFSNPETGRLPARRLRCGQGRHVTWTPFPETCRFKALILQRFQARLTLFSKYFAPFPHGTCSLSDSRKY